MGDFFNNLSQGERDAMMNAVRGSFAEGSPAGIETLAGLAATSTASIQQATITGTLTESGLLSGQNAVFASIASIAEANIYATNSTDNALTLTSTVLAGGATIAPLKVVASLASQAVLQISGVFISTASINLLASQTAFVIPVYHQSQGIVGYINVSKGVV